jgi:glutathione S-transferase
MTHPILYSFRRCPYAIRARLAILVSALVVELREVKLANKPGEMIAASPKATVPVMVLQCGRVIDESVEIMDFALAQNDPQRWLEPVTPKAMEMVSLVDGAFKHHLDRYKYPDRYDGDHLSHRTAGFDILAKFDAIVSRQAFLAGERFSFIDAAIFPFVRQYAAVDVQWFADQPIGALQSWLKTLENSQLFGSAMVSLPVWKAGDLATLFGSSAALASHA